MKKSIFLIIIVFLMTLIMPGSGFAANDNHPAIELNDMKLQASAHIEYGNVYLPLSEIAEAVGYKVEWHENDNTITVSKPGKSILINLKNETIDADGHRYYISSDYSGNVIAGGMTINNKVYMTSSFYSENMGLKISWDKKNGIVRAKTEKENAIFIKTVTVAYENDKIKVTVQYPQLQGLDNPSVQDEINAYFVELATDSVKEGLKNANQMAKDNSGTAGSAHKAETYFNYRLKYNRNGLLSVVFTNYQYTGGAHGMAVQSSSTIDLKTGKKFSLKDFFQNNSEYVSLINNTVRNEIDERNKDGLGLSEFPKSPFKTIKEDQGFYLADNAIVIYFQEYEYFPYAAGIQEFPVDFLSLKKYLKPDFAFLIKDPGAAASPGGSVICTGSAVVPSDGSVISPDAPDNTSEKAPFFGSMLAYAAENGLYYTGLNSGKAIQLVKGKGISMPVFSSDGKAIAYLQNNTLYDYDLAASKALKLLDNADSCCPGQDGRFYASSQKKGIVAVNPFTAVSSTIIPAENGTIFNHLILSPDSRYLAYDSVVSGLENQGKGGVWLYDTSLKKKKLIVKAVKTENFLLGVRPSASKWSNDSGKIFIWMMSQSGSLSADGVGAAVYDVTSGKMTDLNTCALAYDENVSFAGSTSFALITGGGREMFSEKRVSLFNLRKGLSPKSIEVPDKASTTPCFSQDGKMLAFAASPSAKADDNYKNKMATVSKRQIYLYKDGKISTLTKDSAYRSEAPLFLKNGSYIVFARVGKNGETSVWTMESNGKNQKQLAGWKYSNPNDDRSIDFYGRIDWSRMFSLYDDSKGI